MSSSEVSPELMERAKRPRLVFGRGKLRELSAAWRDELIVTTPPALEAARPLLARRPAKVCFVETMDRGEVERLEHDLPLAQTIVGLGGGMALDLAKYVAWKRGASPVIVPSIASVDACVTNSIAVRDERRVRYLGFVVPEVVISDFELMSSAPPRLNRAGVGDILSIHTGCFDWRLAAQAGEIEYLEAIAQAATALLDQMLALGPELKAVSDRALRFLIEAYAAENELCLTAGHSRPEEGSEHFFAYNLERRTGRSFIHGELVALGAVLMSRLQQNRPERVERFLDDASVRWRPSDLGLTRAEVETALLTLRDYADAERLYHSIVNERELDPAVTEALMAGLTFS